MAGLTRSEMERRHVLVLDGDADYSRILKRELLGLGVGQVSTTDTPEEALRLLRDRTKKIDLLVTELYLPFIRFLRTSPKSPKPQLPIVLSTAKPQVEDLIKARDAGINTCIAKPVAPTQLAAHLAAALTDKREFIETGSYCGPDRRRNDGKGYRGEERRGVASVRARLARLDGPLGGQKAAGLPGR